MRRCIDLCRLAAGKYRLSRDPSYQAERSDLRRTESPWLWRIPCKYGHILPWSSDRLAAYATGCRMAKRLEHLPGVRREQGGGPGALEVVVSFEPARLDQVAQLIRAQRKRHLSPARRAAVAAALSRWRARQKAQPRSEPASRESTNAAPDNSDIDPETRVDSRRGHVP